MNFGERIIQLREEKGMSRADLTEKTGLSRSFVSQLENNRKKPSFKSLIIIANALNVKVEDITKDLNSDTVITFGDELDKMCKEYGLDTSKLDKRDLEELVSKIFILMKKIVDNKDKKNMD